MHSPAPPRAKMISACRIRSSCTVLGLVAAIACGGTEPSPLFDMPSPTAARVRAAAQAAVRTPDRWAVRDTLMRPAALDSLMALVFAPARLGRLALGVHRIHHRCSTATPDALRGGTHGRSSLARGSQGQPMTRGASDIARQQSHPCRGMPDTAGHSPRQP